MAISFIGKEGEFIVILNHSSRMKDFIVSHPRHCCILALYLNCGWDECQALHNNVKESVKLYTTIRRKFSFYEKSIFMSAFCAFRRVVFGSTIKTCMSSSAYICFSTDFFLRLIGCHNRLNYIPGLSCGNFVADEIKYQDSLRKNKKKRKKEIPFN